MNDVHNIWIESRNELLNTMQLLCKMILQREQVANHSNHTPKPSRRFNSICYDDDDDEESTIPLNEIVSQIPSSIVITPVLLTMEPEDSLIMGDEDLRTNVEDLVPILKESEDTSDGEKECDLLISDNFVTFSNPLSDVNDDFTSNNDEGPHANFQCQSRNQNFDEPNPCYSSNSFGFDQPSYYSIDHQEDLNQQRMNDVHNIWIESRNELLNTMQSLCEMILQREQESTITLNEIVSQIPPSIVITPVLLTMEPEDSLIKGDEDLRTSVEDLVPILREFEDTSDSEKECDLPISDNFVTFSNPLSDVNDDFTSNNDESLPKEDVQEENFKIYSNPLFEFDDEYISTDVNPLFNEVLEDIDNKDSYVSNLDELALLVTPLFDANEDECFDPGSDIDKIDAFLDIDISTDIEDDYHDSEGDIIYLESLLINDTIPNLLPEEFLDHDPRSFKDEPDNDDLKSMVKVFDPGIHEKIISPTYVRLPFEDHHYLSLTFVIKIFLPFLTYLVNSLPLLSSGSEDTIFDPDISVFSFYSLEPMVSYRSGTFMCFNVYLIILNESSMEICSSTCFVPNIMMIWRESS
nr:hypothetical protein [Tanacetum cinerariifolium]